MNKPTNEKQRQFGHYGFCKPHTTTSTQNEAVQNSIPKDSGKEEKYPSIERPSMSKHYGK